MVNFLGIAIDAETIINFLKQEVRLKDICQEIILQEIIQRASQAHKLPITDEEIQAEATRQRYEMRIESADATYAWLEDQMMTPDNWETGIRHRLQAEKLSKALFQDSIQAYFAQHQLEYERAVLYHISVPYELLAQELFYQIEEEEISFYEAAHLYDMDERRRLYCGYEDLVHRWSLDPELSAQIFGIKPKELIGPIQSKESFNLYMVEEFLPAELTEEVAQVINQKLFKEWLMRELNYRVHQNDSPMSNPRL